MPSQAPFTKIYDNDYFNAAQVSLYIGDVWVDEVTSLQYVIQQTKRPLYGYASQLFDDTAAGQVIVQGSFSINFKEAGYLWAVLRRYKQISLDAAKIDLDHIQNKQARKRISNYDRKLLKGGGDTSRPITQSNGTVVDRGNIERITSGNVSRQERYDFYSNLAGYSTFDVDSPKDREFEAIVEAFEDQVWVNPSDTDLNSQLRRTDDNVFDDFDIYVVFGDYSSPGANHSVNKIVGVRLLSQGKSITMDTGVVQEEYSFIAQSVV